MKHATVSLETNGLELLDLVEYRSPTPTQERSPTSPDSFVVVRANRRTTNGGPQLQHPFSSPPLNTHQHRSRSFTRHSLSSPCGHSRLQTRPRWGDLDG